MPPSKAPAVEATPSPAAMATTRKISARATRLRIDKLPLIPATPVHSGNDGLALTRSVPAQHVLRVISHENTPKGVALGAPDTAVCRTASADRRISPSDSIRGTGFSGRAPAARRAGGGRA